MQKEAEHWNELPVTYLNADLTAWYSLRDGDPFIHQVLQRGAPYSEVTNLLDALSAGAKDYIWARIKSVERKKVMAGNEDYKTRLERELLEKATGGADLYLYRNTPRATRIVEQLDPPKGGAYDKE